MIKIVATRSHFQSKNASNSISAGAPPQTTLGTKLTALPRSPRWILRGLTSNETQGGKEGRTVEGREGVIMEGKEKGRKWEGRGGKGTGAPN